MGMETLNKPRPKQRRGVAIMTPCILHPLLTSTAPAPFLIRLSGFDYLGLARVVRFPVYRVPVFAIWFAPASATTGNRRSKAACSNASTPPVASCSSIAQACLPSLTGNPRRLAPSQRRKLHECHRFQKRTAQSRSRRRERLDPARTHRPLRIQ